MSSFFRRPGDGSSDSDSSGDEDEIDPRSQPQAGNEDDEADLETRPELATTESLSHDANLRNIHVAEDRPARSTSGADQRDMLLATLLEDYYRGRAVELIRDNTGVSYDKLAPEVQPLARELFDKAGQALSSSGFLPAIFTSDERRSARNQYLTGLDTLSLRSVRGRGDIPADDDAASQIGGSRLALIKSTRTGTNNLLGLMEQPAGDLVLRAGGMSISSPIADMQFHRRQIPQSHYESSFQQLRLLGKGGFGKVYRACNIFDQKDYAIKKIPLSPKLSRRYREGGHHELESVLREVQALANLDHCAVVRYHATWIEEPKVQVSSPPQSLPPSLRRQFPAPRQRLLDSRPHNTPKSDKSKFRGENQVSEGIVFGHDSGSRRDSHGLVSSRNEWSSHELYVAPEPTSAHESDVFTDGNACPSASTGSDVDETVYVLHVQMSLYPMTLAQFLSPISPAAASAPSLTSRRHCFHLLPALRILLGVLCGLQYVHAKNLIHRDIKPGNIFLSTTSDAPAAGEGFYDMSQCVACPDASEPFYVNPRIGDFGLVAELAESIDKGSSHQGTLPGSKPVGTEYYRPPVQHNSSGQVTKPRIDEKVDVFALGVILVEMLWCCRTSSERLHVLTNLQKGKIPKGLEAQIESEGHEPGLERLVTECIRGMIDRNSDARWSCARVRGRVELILKKCQVGRAGESLVKVKSLSGTEDDEGAAEDSVGE